MSIEKYLLKILFLIILFTMLLTFPAFAGGVGLFGTVMTTKTLVIRVILALVIAFVLWSFINSTYRK